MDDKDRRMISFQVSAEEAKAIEGAADNAGISRSEYLRQKVLSSASGTPDSETEALLRRLIYITNCTRAAV